MESSSNTLPTKRIRKIEKKWASDEVNLVIALIEERPALWDYTSQEYRNRDIREANWQEISLVTNRSVSDCKAEWNCVKSRYNSERRKQATTKSGQVHGQRYSSRYEYYNALGFLNAVAERPACTTRTNMQTYELELMDNPITIEYMTEDIGGENDGVTPKRAKVAAEATSDRTARINKINKHLDARSKEPSWKKVFAEHVFCELNRYSEVEAHRLKKQINALLDNFEPEEEEKI